ncbi:MAG: TrkH family potassium uptake protein [Phycisphaerales bacterium JB060]
MERLHTKPLSPNTVGPRRALAALGVAILGVTALALDAGLPAAPWASPWLKIAQIVLPWFASNIMGGIAWLAPPRLGRTGRWRRPMGLAVELGAVLALFAWPLGYPQAAGALAAFVVIAQAIGLTGLLARTMRHPNLLLPASFAAIIIAATLLLKLPAATPYDQPIGWIDALFTATSATCVTGLAVRDTAGGFTLFGQVVIAGAIQLGGLGFMIFGSTLALLFGVRPSYKEHLTLSAALDEYPAHRIMRFAWFIVGTTLAIEAIGAVLLYLLWPGALTDGPGGRAWQAVFHSVSAFCNAGFDITGDSLIPMRTGLAPFLVIAPLIVVGGLGFLVLEDVTNYLRRRIRRKPGRATPRLATHSKLVLATTACLLGVGFVTIFIAQSVASGGPSDGAITDAAFMSVTARTAGFTVMPMEELSPGSRFSLMVLMAIGGSPGSTAGGIKTAVFAVLILAVLATVRGREDVEVFGRALPDTLVRKAATVAAGLVGVVTLATLMLDLSEDIPFEPLLFEVVSAASTTGLSLGATAELSPFGRVVITLTMFFGRLGALSLLGALIQGVGVGGERALTRSHLPRDTVSLG